MIPQQGLTTILKDKMANIEAKARAFLMSDDKIGFIAKLMQDSPTEVAPIVNAGRRIAGEQKSMMMAQAQGTQPSVTENNLKAITEPVTAVRSGGAISSLPIKDSMFRAAGGGIVAFANGGGIQPNFYPGLPGVNRAQAIENEKRKRIMEAEREANKQGKTLFAPRRSPGFVDFLGEDSPITTPSLPPGQSYTPGIFGLMRGQLANQKAADAVDTPRPQLSQADIQAIASGDKTAQDVDLSRAADIDALTDLQRLERFAGSGDTGEGPKNLLKDAILSDDQDKAGKDDFTPTMVDTGLMGKEGVSVDIVPFQALSAEEIMGQAKKAADELFPTIEGTNNIANPEKAVAEYRAFLEQSGVDLNNSEQKAALQKEEALLAKDKKEGAMYALLEFGFGLMAGKSPNALTNVGEAGKAVAPRLFQLQKDLRAGQQRLTNARLKLAELENAQKTDIAKGAMAKIEKQKDRVLELRKANEQNRAQFVNTFARTTSSVQNMEIQRATQLQTTEMTTGVQRERLAAQKEIANLGLKLENDVRAIQQELRKEGLSLQEKQKLIEEQNRLVNLISRMKASSYLPFQTGNSSEMSVEQRTNLEKSIGGTPTGGV